MAHRHWFAAAGSATVAAALILAPAATRAPAVATPEPPEIQVTPIPSVGHDRSPRLDRLQPERPRRHPARVAPWHPAPPVGARASRPAPRSPAPATNFPVSPMPATSVNVDGLSNSDNYRFFGGRVLPPDPNGDVGPNHYVQAVNNMLAVYRKDGSLQAGPLPNYALWDGFGNDCATSTNGDPIVQYDQLADRWVISQMAGAQTPDHKLECVAVSTSGDPAGSYHRYSFDFGSNLPDYPKWGVWPDGYYMSVNLYADNVTFMGAGLCAFDRASMLAGRPSALGVCGVSPSDYSILPSDVDGPTPPPAGSPNYMIGEDFGTGDQLIMFRFHVDWSDVSESTLTPVTIPVTPYLTACPDGRFRAACVPQKDTPVTLASMNRHLMYRLAYRNFGDHESLVATHTIDADGVPPDSQTAIGWYEIRTPGTTPTLHQEAVFNPDSSVYRWMGSIAMDSRGDISVGYSASSSEEFPSIRYVGRLVSDPLNTMPYEEATMMSSTTNQPNSQSRWGDYTAMQVDPVDDCTFWYTNQYLEQDPSLPPTSAPWKTRIGSFRFPSCTGSTTPPGAPRSVAGQPLDRGMRVSWKAPASNGGMAVTGYTVTADAGGGTCSTLVGVDPDPLSCDITGLTNGSPYTFTVKARNALGQGPGTAAGPFYPLAAPSGVTVAVNSSSVTARWVPVGVGYSYLANLTVTSRINPPVTRASIVTGRQVSWLIRHIPPGSSYQVCIRTKDAHGLSLPACRTVTGRRVAGAGPKQVHADRGTGPGVLR